MPQRPWLAGLDAQTFYDFVDYVLGKKVYRIDRADQPRPKPPWRLVLSYECAMRREAFKLVRGGETMNMAFQKVIRDAEIRSLHFVEQLLNPSGKAY